MIGEELSAAPSGGYARPTACLARRQGPATGLLGCMNQPVAQTPIDALASQDLGLLGSMGSKYRGRVGPRAVCATGWNIPACPAATMSARRREQFGLPAGGLGVDCASQRSGAVVANPGQGHRLVAGGTQPADPAVLPIRAATATRSTTSPDTGLAGTQSLHLFLGSQLRGAQDGAVSPFEVAAIRVMPQPRLVSCGRTVEVHGVDHVPNIWMLHRARHGEHPTSHRAAKPGPATTGLLNVLI